jgi:hypothetical protein
MCLPARRRLHSQFGEGGGPVDGRGGRARQLAATYSGHALSHELGLGVRRDMKAVKDMARRHNALHVDTHTKTYGYQQLKLLDSSCKDSTWGNKQCNAKVVWLHGMLRPDQKERYEFGFQINFKGVRVG